MGMVNISKTHKPIGIKMPAQYHRLVFNERQGNTHTKGQVANGPKIITDTAMERGALYTQVAYHTL